MIKAHFVYYQEGAFRLGEPLLLNFDRIVSITPKFLGQANVSEEIYSSIYQIETVVHNFSNSLTLCSKELDDLFKEKFNE